MSFLYGPTSSERAAAARKQTEAEKRKLERQIRDSQAAAADARTRGDNAIRAGLHAEADTYYRVVFREELKQRRLTQPVATLDAAALQMQQAEVANTASRALSDASRAMTHANRRMPVVQVQRDAMALSRATEQMQEKMEIIDEATSYDDEMEDTEAIQDEKRRIAALRESALQRDLPASAPLPGYAMRSAARPSTVAPDAFTADSLGLPPLAPLPSQTK